MKKMTKWMLLFSGFGLAFFQVKAQDKIIDHTEKIIYNTTGGSGFLTLDTRNGRVGINTPSPTQALEVNGKVLIRKANQAIEIKTTHPYNLWVTDGVVAEDLFIVNRTNWADSVFEDNYQPLSLNELSKFIDSCKHLPNIPSAKQVKTDGYSQHDINAKLLGKIEDLVLYTLQQQKEMDKQNEILQLQRKQIEELLQLIEQQKIFNRKEK